MLKKVPILCSGCTKPVYDKFVLKVNQNIWHEHCVVCSQCRCPLTNTCFVRNERLFCRLDYIRLYGYHCQCCNEVIYPNEPVFRCCLNSNNQLANKQDGEFASQVDTTWCYFHVMCFKCCVCGRLLTTGDEYALKNNLPLCILDYEQETDDNDDDNNDDHGDKAFLENSFYNNCKYDRVGAQPSTYLTNNTNKHRDNSNSTQNTDNSEMLHESSDESSKCLNDEEYLCELETDSESEKNSKRPRTILTSSQRKRFKAVFELNPKPNRKIREALASESDLNIRVVQVWFQNQRAKMKKIARRQAHEFRQKQLQKKPQILSHELYSNCHQQQHQQQNSNVTDVDHVKYQYLSNESLLPTVAPHSHSPPTNLIECLKNSILQQSINFKPSNQESLSTDFETTQNLFNRNPSLSLMYHLTEHSSSYIPTQLVDQKNFQLLPINIDLLNVSGQPIETIKICDNSTSHTDIEQSISSLNCTAGSNDDLLLCMANESLSVNKTSSIVDQLVSVQQSYFIK